MSRYRPKHQVTTTVSQEILGTILTGAIAYGVVYSLLKKANPSQGNSGKTKVSKKELTLYERLQRLVEKTEHASVINTTTILTPECIDVKDNATAGDVITATRKLINQIKPLIKKTDPIFKKLYALADSDKDLSDDEFDEAGALMATTVFSVIKSGAVICGHKFTLHEGMVVTNSPDKGYWSEGSEVPAPTRNQFDSLLKITIELYELCSYAHDFGVAEYNQSETEWIYNIHDILDVAVETLVIYIEKSLK